MSNEKKKVLLVSFSEISNDPRLVRQIRVLKNQFQIDTIGYGDTPDGVSQHFKIPKNLDSLPKSIIGIVALVARQFNKAIKDTPAYKYVENNFYAEQKDYDLIICNEIRSVPIIKRATNLSFRSLIIDLHEYHPLEHEDRLVWRILIAPYMHYLCKTYLSSADALFTVSDQIAALYKANYSADALVVKNATKFEENLHPIKVDSQKIKMVHSGGAVAGRGIERLIETAKILGDRYSLDLYLVKMPNSSKYFKKIQNLASKSSNVKILPPVPQSKLAETLNSYDVGIYLLEPKSTNNEMALPNKFFDFIQGRLCLGIGPSPAMAEIVNSENLGVVSEDFSAQSLAKAIKDLSADQIMEFKVNSDKVAEKYSSYEQERIIEKSVLSLISRNLPYRQLG